MSILKDKSEDNFKAIDLLDSGNLFTPGVHCAYYGSLQLVMHYYYVYSGKSYKEAQSAISASSMGSHVYYVNQLVVEISRNLDRKNATKFLKFFNKFKRKRNDADYSLITVGKEDLEQANINAKKIKKFLYACDEGRCENIDNY